MARYYIHSRSVIINDTFYSTGTESFFNAKMPIGLIGIEKRHPFGKRFAWFYGLDARAGYSFGKTDSLRIYNPTEMSIRSPSGLAQTINRSYSRTRTQANIIYLGLSADVGLSFTVKRFMIGTGIAALFSNTTIITQNNRDNMTAFSNVNIRTSVSYKF